MELLITCEVCNKSRVAYFANKPSSSQIKEAKAALKNVRYVCGGRVSSFGRSLSVMEEIAGDHIDRPEIDDEIENENLGEIEGSPVTEEVTEVMDELEEEVEEPVRKRKKIMIIESDDESEEEDDDSDVIDILSNPEQEMLIPVDVIDSFEHEKFEASSEIQKLFENNSEVFDSIEAHEDMQPTEEPEVFHPTNSKASCSFCTKFETGHQCKFCHLPCCNLCNTVYVDELTDIVCPNCPQEDRINESDEPVEKTEKKGRGRPRKKVSSGTILIPLCVRKKRGRPSKQTEEAEVEIVDEIDDENNNETAMSPRGVRDT